MLEKLQLAILLTAVMFIAACSRTSDEASEGPAVARSHVQRGPVQVTVEVTPAKVLLSNEPTLTLTIDHRQDVTVEEPVFTEAIGDFRISEVRRPEPQIRDDRRIVRREFTLEPTRTGTLPIWPIIVSFTEPNGEGDGKQHTVETERLAVEVGSVIDGPVHSLDALRKQSPTVEPSGPHRWPIWASVTAGVLIAAAVLAWWLRRRRTAAIAPAPLTPGQRAILELKKLWESKLAERDVKLYYVELTGIVRRYIEVATGIRAPEQTTEEFLHEISRRDTFAAEESRRLRNFLEAADLVKFAAHRPLSEAVEESYKRAEAFVGLEQAVVIQQKSNDV